MTTTVVHSKREPYDVYIGRPSKWGNPFSIGSNQSRPMVILAFEEWFKGQLELQSQIAELRGKRLGCWCKPKDCHGDVLAHFADTGRFLSDADSDGA